MNSKGQVAGQIFIYIMAIVVVGAIAIIGYQAIQTVTTKACDVEKLNFKADIENLIEKYTSYGSVNKKTLKAPCDYDTVCFVDTTTMLDPGNSAYFSCSSPVNNQMIFDSVTSNVEQNIFVISNKKTIPIGYSPLIRLSEDDKGKCLCIKQRSRSFFITFEGFGSYTQLRATT